MVMEMSNTKRPWLAVILNLLIPGLGHIYLDRTKRGIVLFFLTAAVAAISSGMGWIVGVILCSYDAYQIAKGMPAPFDFLEKYIGE
jgi:TM2 domain-containing membrane protein YozV